jgi:hypothetical protein
VSKRKADIVSDAMRQRLASNRNGVIATDQWLDLVTEPLVVLLLVVAPAMVVLGPRFSAFAVSLRLPFLLLLGFLAIVVPILLRARRYARAPIHFDVLYADQNIVAPLMFWRKQRFETKSGEPISFSKRLSPPMFFRPGYAYLVYYLEDGDQNVMLSVAPADHADAEHWMPTKSFEMRQRRRAR